MATQTGSYDFTPAKNAHDDAEKVATNFIAEINNGVFVHAEGTPADPTNANAVGVEITDQIDIIREGESVMAVGETNTSTGNEVVRIGKSGESREELDYHSFKMISKEGRVFAHFSDLRDENGQFTTTEHFAGTDIAPLDLKVAMIPLSSPAPTVTINGTAISEFSFNSSGVFTISPSIIPSTSDDIAITYTTTDQQAQAFTLGSRMGTYSGTDYSGRIGKKSTAIGNSVCAAGMYAFAEGNLTRALGEISHAEGTGTIAGTMATHAEGNQSKAYGQGSHAEGWVTEADGLGSHSEGGNTLASGDYSHAQNYYTEAGYDYQTAIGKYNLIAAMPTSGLYSMNAPLVIGNGTSDSDRHNALIVTWDGDIIMDLADYNLSGTTDYEIYQALDALGWVSDVLDDNDDNIVSI